MAMDIQTLTQIQSLEWLYRSGYRSETVDATIDKLVTMERAQAARELARMEAVLHKFEEQYQLPSEEFHRRFQAGNMGDEADFFEWSAFYQMWLSTREQLDLLKAVVEE